MKMIPRREFVETLLAYKTRYCVLLNTSYPVTAICAICDQQMNAVRNMAQLCPGPSLVVHNICYTGYNMHKVQLYYVAKQNIIARELAAVCAWSQLFCRDVVLCLTSALLSVRDIDVEVHKLMLDIYNGDPMPDGCSLRELPQV
jgi:hypothetical protein